MRQLCMSRPFRLARRIGLAVTVLTLASCGNERFTHKVYPVKGKIQVNGQPAKDCQVVLNPTYEDKHPIAPLGRTNDAGEFQITSYTPNDGAPEGQYVVTVTWPKNSGQTYGTLDGIDQLGDAYATVDKTKGMPGFTIKVERQPLELPPFDLKQSAAVKRRVEGEANRKKMDFSGPLGGR